VLQSCRARFRAGGAKGNTAASAPFCSETPLSGGPAAASTMAFDAAANGDFGSAARGGGGASETDSLITVISQRVWTLAQTIGIVEKLVEQLGTPADNATLRQRLSAAESKADGLRAEIDSGSRRLRVEGLGGVEGFVNKQAERLLQQYGELRKRVVEVLRNSQSRQRASRPVDDGVAESFSAVGARPGTGQRLQTQVARDTVELSAIRPLDDVDEAIVEERRRDAEAIAHEAVEVHNVMRDIGGLVQTQGENITQVETTVDATRDTVIAANKDLVKAASYQSSYRKKCCFWWFLVLVLLAVILVPTLLTVLKK